MRRLLIAVVAAALGGGCTVGPNYSRPQVAVPGVFRGASGASGASGAFGDSKWQTLFADDTMNKMVSQALDHNFDLRIAVERVEEARAQLGITRADQFPFVDAQTSFTGSRSSSIGSAGPLVPATARIRDSYTTVGAALSWEVDLWGRLRRLTEAARAGFLASQEGRHAVEVSLVSDVMESYFQLLEQDSELDISRKTVAAAQDSLRIVELRHSGGAASALDVREAEQLLYTATARIAAAQRAIAQTENQLSLLQGNAPDAQPRGRKLEEIPIPAEVTPGTPAQLLERRPDIRQAEQNLIAANAEIGAARALYYPNISLSAFAGAQSRYLLDLATAPARVYTAAPSAIQAIFHGGQLKNQVRLSEAQEREMLVTYQQSIYTGLKEVADALIGFDRLKEERGEQQKLVNTLEDAVRLSDLRYRGGLDTYLQVLDAQRNLFAGQLTLAQLRLAERSALVQIYRALGGGWS